jgi:hypothetical protein
MKQSWTKRLEHLEAAAAPHHAEPLPGGRLGTILAAQSICFALELGKRAIGELAEAGAAINPERRDKLTKTLEGARRVAAALASNGPPLISGTPLGDLVASVGSLKTEGEPA